MIRNDFCQPKHEQTNDDDYELPPTALTTTLSLTSGGRNCVIHNKSFCNFDGKTINVKWFLFYFVRSFLPSSSSTSAAAAISVVVADIEERIYVWV